jgi:YVTN family beta-propeller protein
MEGQAHTEHLARRAVRSRSVARAALATCLAGLVPLVAVAVQAAPRLLLPRRVVATVPVGYRPYGVGVNPSTHKVYVTNNASNTVSVIDGTTNVVVASVAVGREPYYWLGVLPSLDRIYVVNNGGGAVDGTLSVIDGGTDTVAATVSGLGLYPVGIAVHEGRQRVYVEGDERLVEVDAVTGAVLRTVAMPGQSSGLVIDPALDMAVSVYGVDEPIETHAWLLPDILPMGDTSDWSGYPAVNTATHRAFYANRIGQQVVVQDLTDLTVEAHISLALRPFIAAVDPDRSCLYLTNPGFDFVTVVDTVAQRELGIVRVGKQPSGVAADPTNGRVYVANTGDGTVSVIQGERCDLAGTATPTPVPPTATALPSATARPSATPGTSATPAPSATRAATAPPGPTAPAACVCRITHQRVPGVVLDDAVANPRRYLGWLQPLDPGKPPSPANPRRTCLALQNFALDYHPLWNRPIWRVGCP